MLTCPILQARCLLSLASLLCVSPCCLLFHVLLQGSNNSILRFSSLTLPTTGVFFSRFSHLQNAGQPPGVVPVISSITYQLMSFVPCSCLSVCLFLSVFFLFFPFSLCFPKMRLNVAKRPVCDFQDEKPSGGVTSII